MFSTYGVIRRISGKKSHAEKETGWKLDRCLSYVWITGTGTWNSKPETLG
jgi:hypothetical protein